MSRTRRNHEHWAWYAPPWPMGHWRYSRDTACRSICCSPKARRKVDKTGGKWMKWGERKLMERGTGE